MSKKLTIEFVRGEFKKEDYILLSKMYENNHQKLEYICPNNHKNSISWNSWQQGCRCFDCSCNKRLTIEFVREQFEKERFVLLSDIYIGANHKLEYICPKGHKGSIRWGDWQQGIKCAECAGLKKLTIGFIKEQFEKEDYILVSNEYINSITSLKYICPRGHKGRIAWCSWKVGGRCLECSGKKKLTIEFIRNEFKKEGYTLLSDTYTNNKTMLEYICAKGHKSFIVWSSWQNGKRCKECHIEDLKGDSNPNWNPSLTKKERNSRKERRRYILGYTDWSRLVKERDNFTCQVCGKRGVKVISHHLENYANNIELRIVLENGICLCKKCHKEFHSMYGYKNNTKKHFKEFMGTRV